MLERWGRAVVRAHLAFIFAGLVLLLFWSRIQPYGWTAPLLLGAGVLLGQTPWAGGGGDLLHAVGQGGARLHRRPVDDVGVQPRHQPNGRAGGRAGRRPTRAPHSRRDPEHRPSQPGRAGAESQRTWERKRTSRYRYTGLRRIIERNGRYYLLPLGWDPRTGPTYVIQDGNDVRVRAAARNAIGAAGGFVGGPIAPTRDAVNARPVLRDPEPQECGCASWARESRAAASSGTGPYPAGVVGAGAQRWYVVLSGGTRPSRSR